MSAAEVHLDRVTKRYGEVDALLEASLELEPGCFLVLLGPSGSGKTTLLRCLAGIEKVSTGEIRLDRQLASGARTHVPPDRRDLGMVFQDFALWPHMTVLENVAFPLKRRRLGRAESGQRASAMLEKVGLSAYAARYPHELSGGQQQRVALARALVARPGLLLFDEPLSALDANLRERLRVEIGTLAREHEATSVYITHDQAEAFALGDRIGLLQEGRLIQIGTPEAIYGSPATPFVARFTGISGSVEGRLLAAPPRSPGLGRVLVPSSDPGVHLVLEATVMAELEPGAAVQVLLRPTATRIIRSGARAAVLRTVVRDGAYHGRGYFYVLEAGAGVDFTGVFDRRRFARGESVDIYIDPAGALVYATDARTPARPLDADAVLARGDASGVPAGSRSGAGRPGVSPSLSMLHEEHRPCAQPSSASPSPSSSPVRSRRSRPSPSSSPSGAPAPGARPSPASGSPCSPWRRSPPRSARRSRRSPSTPCGSSSARSCSSSASSGCARRSCAPAASRPSTTRRRPSARRPPRRRPPAR